MATEAMFHRNPARQARALRGPTRSRAAPHPESCHPLLKENASISGAEIGLQHNLGLTCDPVGGLVQVPCIERKAMATSLFGISNDVAMQVVAIGFVISVVQDSAETALNSSTDMLLTAAGCPDEVEVPLSGGEAVRA